jgi:hypothetical protein
VSADPKEKSPTISCLPKPAVSPSATTEQQYSSHRPERATQPDARPVKPSIRARFPSRRPIETRQRDVRLCAWAEPETPRRGLRRMAAKETRTETDVNLLIRSSAGGHYALSPPVAGARKNRLRHVMRLHPNPNTSESSG